MLDKPLLFFVLFMSVFVCNAQEQSAQAPQITRSIETYLEVGGAAGFGSINFEKNIGLLSNRSLFARVGIGTILLLDFEGKFNPDLLFPLGLSVEVLKGLPLFLGAGVVVFSNPRYQLDKGKTRVWDSGGYLDLGYRKQIGASSWDYGVSWTPRMERWERFSIGWFGIQIRKTW